MQRKAIKKLPVEVAHRIAAGEVVDRPSSLIKELIENSIDASATTVRITLMNGGLEKILVEDDGIGFRKEDLLIALERHATSKIESAEDLDCLFSLGFRGEALSAISSVSQVHIDSCSQEDGAWSLYADFGKQEELEPGFQKSGTRLEITGLFDNVPARKKFLKKPATEVKASREILESLALAHPEITFEWYFVNSEGELKESNQFQKTSAQERFVEVAGLQGELIECKSSDESIGLKSIEVYAAPPPANSFQQKSVSLIVNGRPIFDKSLAYSMREAYAGLIHVGAFPWVHVRVEVDPSIIDVNIHPQKKELRWPKGFSLPGIAYRQLRPHFEIKAKPTVESQQESIDFNPQKSARNKNYTNREFPVSAPTGMESSEFSRLVFSGLGESLESVQPNNEEAEAYQEATDYRPSEDEPESPNFPETVSQTIQSRAQTSVRPWRFSDLRVVGEASAMWILCESENGLVLIDQHAAHERVNFEKFLLSPNLIRSKGLLLPIEIELPHTLVDEKEAIQERLQEFAFEFSDRSPKGLLEIIAIPDADRKVDWEKILREVLRKAESSEEPMGQLNELRIKIASSLACHGSVRAGQRLDVDSIKALMNSLDEVNWSGFCPHGRPVYHEMNNERIAQLFDRT